MRRNFGWLIHDLVSAGGSGFFADFPHGRDQAIRLLSSTESERDFLCRLSLGISAVPDVFLESVGGADFTEWPESRMLSIAKSKRRLSIGFAIPNLNSPVSSFGHLFLVAHDSPSPEEDGVVIDFTADSEVDMGTAVRALSSGIPGRFRLRWFHGKRGEYDIEGRDLWIYELNPKVFPSSLTPRLLERAQQLEMKGGQTYSFLNGNCSERALELLLATTEKSRKNPPRIAWPLDDLRYLHRTGWVGHGLRIPATASRASESSDPLRHWLGEIIASSRSADPDEVHTKREAVFTELKTVLPNLMDRGSREERVTEPTLLAWGEEARLGYASSWSLESKPASSIYLNYRRGAFDWVRSDRWRFSRSELKFFSIGANFRSSRISISELVLVHLDAIEPPTSYQEGLTRFVDFGFHSNSSKYGNDHLNDELLLRVGSGVSYHLIPGGVITLGITPVVGLGVATGEANSISSRLEFGSRQSVLINSGLSPRVKILWDWRPIRIGGAGTGEFSMSIIPYSGNKISTEVNLSSFGFRDTRIEGSLSVPLDF